MTAVRGSWVDSLLTRRDRLARAAGIGLLVGIATLAACRRARGPASLEAALDEMAREGKPGLVIAIPNDPARAAALVDLLVACAEDPWEEEWRADISKALAPEHFETRELLLGCVVVFLDGFVIRESIPGALPGDSILCIDADGRRESGAAIGEEELCTLAGFASAARRVVHGEGNERLAGRAGRCLGILSHRAPAPLTNYVERPLRIPAAELLEACRWTSSAAAVRPSSGARPDVWWDWAAHLLSVTDAPMTAEELKALVGAARSNLPLVTYWRATHPKEPVRVRARGLLEVTFAAEVAESETALLPLGIEWTRNEISSGPRLASAAYGAPADASIRVSRRFRAFSAR